MIDMQKRLMMINLMNGEVVKVNEVCGVVYGCKSDEEVWDLFCDISMMDFVDKVKDVLGVSVELSDDDEVCWMK
tara:strand:+ start:2999 stop:3220 length:222 start_codon:yes stop_codon:yes gene_type:complete